MNFKRFHESKNLFDEAYPDISGTIRYRAIFVGDGTFTLSTTTPYDSSVANVFLISGNVSSGASTPNNGAWLKHDVTTQSIDGYVTIAYRHYTGTTSPVDCQTMLNLGSTHLPYEPYGDTWTDTPHYIHNTSTDTITTLPTVLYPNDTTATVGLKGQTLQSSIPSPTSPVMPQGTGERTGNLSKYWKAAYVTASGTVNANKVNGVSFPVKIEAGQTVCFTNQKTNFGRGIAVFSGFDGETPTDMVYRSTNNTVTYTADSDCYVIIWGNYDNTTSMDESVFALCGQMLNLGSTALPYEPYGYKIPISSANTTTPVYLGDVQTMRKIKKLVLDGTESWVNTGGNAPYRLPINDIAISSSTLSIEWYCSHYQSVSINDSWASYDYCISRTSTAARSLQFRDVTKGDITAFKQYLAAQYSAGTPVTVWYVLAEPETGIVNEPLMKIGEYADEVSGISIPVTAGENTLDVQTTVQPSEVTAEFSGWHPVQSVHERENGQWD